MTDTPRDTGPSDEDLAFRQDLARLQHSWDELIARLRAAPGVDQDHVATAARRGADAFRHAASALGGAR